MKIAAFKGAKWDRQAREAAKAAAAAAKDEAKALREEMSALAGEIEKIKKNKGGK